MRIAKACQVRAQVIDIVIYRNFASSELIQDRKSEKPAVFLAGGIGIRPFLRIIRQAGHDQTPHHLYLFYSNRRPEDAAFLDLLSEATKGNPNFHLIATRFYWLEEKA